MGASSIQGKIAGERVQVLGTNLHLYRAGGGPPLLFLHGEEGQHGWRRHHERLAEEFTVLAPTMPGTGESEYPIWLETVPQLAKFYLAALDTLGIGDVILVGASLGGWVAAEMATMCPERVRRLVLEGPMGIRPREGGVEDLFLIIYRDYMQRAFASPQSPAFAEIWGRTPSDEEEEAELEVREMTARFAYRPYMADLTLPPLLARVAAPTLIVVGGEDRITPLDCVLQYEAALPNASIVTIDGAGHFPHLEAPDAFGETVSSFLRGEIGPNRAESAPAGHVAARRR